MTIAKAILLIIDPQIDFHPGGSLGIPGANEDSERTASLILQNIDEIDEIYVTLDSHHRNHIAHGIFWENEKGDHPNPFTLITYEDVLKEKWRPRDKKLLDHCLAYTKYLKEKGKFTLCIWPEHCLIGTVGHAVVAVLNSALQEWAARRNKEIHYVMKGQNCLTEMYSAIKADYEIKEDPRTQRDPNLAKALQNTEKLIVCGQALSHCVNFTFMDILETWPEDRRDRLVLLSDACSPVTGFADSAAQFLTKVRTAGCKIETTGGCDHALPNKSTSLKWNYGTDNKNGVADSHDDNDDDDEHDPYDVRQSILDFTDFLKAWMK